MTRINRYLAVPLLSLSACAVDVVEPIDDPIDEAADELEDHGVPTVPIFFGPNQGMEMQGRYLLGSGVDSLAGAADHHLSVLTAGTHTSGAPRSVQFYGNAGLQVAGTVVDADDIILPGVGGGEVLIDLSRTYPGVTLYHVKYRANSASTWSDPCAGEEAVPLYGSFTTTGLHEDTAGELSFACADGVAFKCSSWGYWAGQTRSSEAWMIHQACTRMARADYCADGTFHTEEETLISIFDEVGVNPQPPSTFYGVATWPPPPGDFYFEAGWREEALPPVCLSKLRWANLPIGGHCPDVLPDPRVDVSAKTCDELAVNAEQLSVLYDTKLFNGARYNSLATHVWKNRNDVISTVDGYYADPAVTPPLQPYAAVGTYQWVAADATLMRSLPGSVDPADVVSVELFTDGTSDLVYLPVSAAGLLPGYTSAGWRGFAFTTEVEETVPLALYQNPTTGDALTTTLTPPNGYVWVDDVAYVKPAAAP